MAVIINKRLSERRGTDPLAGEVSQSPTPEPLRFDNRDYESPDRVDDGPGSHDHNVSKPTSVGPGSGYPSSIEESRERNAAFVLALGMALSNAQSEQLKQQAERERLGLPIQRYTEAQREEHQLRVSRAILLAADRAGFCGPARGTSRQV